MTGLMPGAQAQPSIPRIGWLSLASADDAEILRFFDAFRAGLREVGYIEGHNIILEPRWANGDAEKAVELAAELVRRGVAAIVTQGTAIRAARQVAGAVPVIFALSGDPEKAGLVESLARPGRNFTGATFMSYEVNAKRLQLLKEALPTASRFALLSNPEHPGEQGELEVFRNAAATIDVTFFHVRVRFSHDFEGALATIAKEHAAAIVALPDALVMQHRGQIIEFARKRGIPAVSGWPAFARSGGLMTYGPNLPDSFRVLGRFVDKILKGVSPAEIPVEQPTKFELVINLKAARELGIVIPPTLLAQVDEVIE
ncbi:MAG TPA: ABC transporter substrate-binding protein [Beijerinckiaceae bacterium]|jgi:putative ABC transport system substrate-binding protein